MTFAAGVLLAVVAVDLVINARGAASLRWTVIGLLCGAAVFSSVNCFPPRRPAPKTDTGGGRVCVAVAAASTGSVRVLLSSGSVSRALEEAERPSPNAGGVGDKAYTTLATVLGRLERAGMVARRMDRHTAVYAPPLVSEDQVGHSVLRDLLDRFFAGSHAKLVSQLLDETDVDPDELDQIRELVAEKTQNGKHGTKKPDAAQKRGAKP